MNERGAYPGGWMIEAAVFNGRRAMPGQDERAATVLVVEDDDETRDYIAQALESDCGTYVVTTADSVAPALRALRHEAPDVLLVDIGLPDGSGLELIRCAREASNDIAVLVISVFGDESSVFAAIEAGAQGYLLKSEAPKDLRISVQQVLDGGAPISPGIAGHLLRHFAEQAPEPAQLGARERLTRRERDVLDLMVKGLSYQEAAEMLHVSRNTVASHVKSIYRKLEVGSRGEAVFEALTRGLVKVDSGCGRA